MDIVTYINKWQGLALRALAEGEKKCYTEEKEKQPTDKQTDTQRK